MASSQEKQDDYVLGRNILSRVRLNYQHFSFPKVFGYLLHPGIPRGENLKIADVATGSGIWMLDVMSELSTSNSYHGFDIDLSQTPPQAWLPPNVTFSKVDFEKEIPTEFQGVFDVVNVRLLVLVVKGNDPTQVLVRIQQMLKPGGWLQWTEPDVSNLYEKVVTSNSQFNGSAMKALHQKLIPNDIRFQPTWPLKLPEIFQASGFEQVSKDVKSAKDFLPWLAFISDNAMLTYRELIDRMPTGPVRPELDQMYGEAVKESWNGTAPYTTRINVIGQKPIA